MYGDLHLPEEPSSAGPSSDVNPVTARKSFIVGSSAAAVVGGNATAPQFV